ncbi:type II secretion system F family protein [Bailinhaonella thermotolerans]|uniref:Type II secretion system F family protein n=1 Tax=Bailinhaonella thermotolerans TaxID=1070861 RepID=A0A3A4A0D8_9ACTN|nr:type II secretion system F family protein [Bailinhaonella thermotolerans]RJL20408.1 type II secretion system F family protein [Bailinhaonella thermotolerans]
MTSAALAGLAAVLLAALAGYLSPQRRPAERRLAALLAPPAPRPARQEAPGRRDLILAAGAAFLAWALVGGVPGVLAAALAGPGVALFLRRRQPPEVARRRARITRDLPFAADLIAVCLRAGSPPETAVAAAAEAVGGPLGERLAWVAGQLRLGADPEPTWQALTADPPLAPLARAMVRASASGAPLADLLSRTAEEARHASRALATAAARRAGVQAVAPLGLCFLPAFVLLGIIPPVAGLATTLWPP